MKIIISMRLFLIGLLFLFSSCWVSTTTVPPRPVYIGPPTDYRYYWYPRPRYYTPPPVYIYPRPIPGPRPRRR